MATRISASVRFILAVLHLSESVDRGFWPSVALHLAARKSLEEIYSNLLYLDQKGSITRPQKNKMERIKQRLIDDGTDPSTIAPVKPEKPEKPEASPVSQAENWGRAVTDILKSQYPTMLEEMAEDDRYRENPAAVIGNRMFRKALKEVQYNDEDAADAIQDFLRYLVESKFNFKKETKSGSPGAETWRQALNNIMSNVRARAKSHSYKKFRKGENTDEELYADLLYKQKQSEESGRYKWTPAQQKKLDDLRIALIDKGVDVEKIQPKKKGRKNKRNLTIDEAFGSRGEGGDEPEGGEGRIPGEGMAIDDSAAMRSFLDTLDELVYEEGGLRDELKKDPEQLLLFDFIMGDHGWVQTEKGEVDKTGTFITGIGNNMAQASLFRDWLEELVESNAPEARLAKEMLAKRGHRWSASITKVRNKLLKSIIKFTEEAMTPREFDQLWEAMYGQMTLKDLEKGEDAKLVPAKSQFSDETRKRVRKLIRLIQEDKRGLLSPQEVSQLTQLKTSLTQEFRREGKSLPEVVSEEKARILLEKSGGGPEKYRPDLKNIVYLEARDEFGLLDEKEKDQLTKLRKRIVRVFRPLGLSPQAELHDARKEHYRDARKEAWKEVMDKLEAEDVAKEAIRDVDDRRKIVQLLDQGMSGPEAVEEVQGKKPRFPSLEERKRSEGPFDVEGEGEPVHDITGPGGVNPEKMPLRPTMEERLKAMGVFDEVEDIEKKTKKKMSSVALRVFAYMAAPPCDVGPYDPTFGPGTEAGPPFGRGGDRPRSMKPDGTGPRGQGPKTGLGLGPCEQDVDDDWDDYALIVM